MTAVASSFDDVAVCYDEALNPLLRLEERFLPGILPPLNGRDVLEVGCGTGRWLRVLSQSDPGSLTGVDPSISMLTTARAKLPGQVTLNTGRADEIPLSDKSVDVVLLSFVLSYCPDLEAAAREIARVAKGNASVVVSDMHPGTEARLGWSRSFQTTQGMCRVESRRYEITEIVRIFAQYGFANVWNLELPFGAPEEAVFSEAGRLESLREARNLPAIYLLRFDRQEQTGPYDCVLTGSRIAIGPTASASGSIAISGERIETIGRANADDGKRQIDVTGCLVLPGLINAHDHLEFGLFPRLGRGPYGNSKEWAEGIHAFYKDEIALQTRIPKEVRFYWGALRNLLSGVTTVCHHNPGSSVFDNPDFPVRVVRAVAWAHSLTFEPEARQRYDESPRDWPFIIHAGEGVDEIAAREIGQLDELGLLGSRTVLVHGLSCSNADVHKINAKGAGLIVCPSSNEFLFGRSVESHATATKRLAIGTDSPLTCQADLLDELRTAQTRLSLSAERLYAMCTEASASLLRLRSGEGKLSPHGFADALVVRDRELEPADRLLTLQFDEIELVIIGGGVHFASSSGLARISQKMREHLSPVMVDGALVWVNAPVEWMFRETNAVLGGEISLAGRRLQYVG